MRNIITLSIILLVNITATGQSAIVGTWDLNWNNTKASMNASENEKFTKMPSATKDKVQASFSSRTYVFSSNGTIQISWESESKENNVSGSWTLEGNTLTISVDGKENLYEVAFSGNTLTLSKKGERNLFSVTVFNRRV